MSNYYADKYNTGYFVNIPIDYINTDRWDIVSNAIQTLQHNLGYRSDIKFRNDFKSVFNKLFVRVPKKKSKLHPGLILVKQPVEMNYLRINATIINNKIRFSIELI